ncbi:M23 family metallopeptidase [Nocardioides marinquilinus]|uniref:M23 family metallopeptidase n=1 Tax=Nocardioides marinquilinus TaxID=1210400 RepID=A0ABP9PKK2_9ACTN
MRSFPGAARQRIAAITASLVTLAALAIPLAHADDRDDDLKNRQRDVQGRISDARDELQEASRDASRAAGAVDRVEQRLDVARTHLSDVRVRLQAARDRDALLQQQLLDAEAELDRATTALATASAGVEQQRAEAREMVLTLSTQGDPQVRALGRLLSDTSVEDLTRQQVGDQVLLAQQSRTFQALEEVEATLADERAEVERTTAAVEVKRTEAAEHLETMRGLVTEAETARDRITGLVQQARAARKDAYEAKAADRAVLRKLREREQKIAGQLKALAERQASRKGFVGRSDGYLGNPSNGYVTSPFGYRTHPIYGYYSLHNGTDFGAACGSPLYAAASGTVIDTYYDSVYGNRLYLSIGNVNGKNLVLIYNHMSGYRASEGQRVGRGDVVGYVGTTGWSTGCHLHFTVMADGVAVDPMTYL